MRRLAVSLLIGLLTVLLATPAAAQTPQGQGLTTLASQGIASLSCDDESITLSDVLVPRGGGGATWVSDGRMYLLQAISATGTFTPPGGVPVTDSFTASYGRKSGLTDDTIVCTFTQSGPGFEIEGTVTLVRVR
jgi:hypothetical protein